MLLTKLKSKPFCNDLHYFLIAVTLLFLSIKFVYFYIILVIFLIFIFKKTKLIIPIISLLCILFIRYTLLNNNYNEVIDTNLYGTIIEKDDKSYIIKSNNNKILVYSNKNLDIGDEINCKISYYSFSDVSYDGDFNYKDYLYSQGIKAYGRLDSYTILNKDFNINIIKYNILTNLKAKLKSDTYSYVEALVFGENNLNDGLKEGYSMLGIAHILAISGMHIFLLAKLLELIMYKLFRIPQSKVPLIFIGIYTLILGFKPSILRAFLFLIIGKLNEKGYIKYTKLDILSISFIILLLIRPFMFYQTGFLLTFLVSFILIFMSEFIKSKNKIKKLYLSSIIIYLITLPLTISFYNKISIFSILLGPTLAFVLIYLLLPLSFISALFCTSIFEGIFSLINTFILGVIKYNYTITIPSFNIFIVIIYYVILLFLLAMLAYKKKPFIPGMLLLALLLIISNLRVLNPYNKVTFLSCGQGDSSLIELKNDKGMVLIDAYNSYDYLKSRGITHLNYIVVTHSDIDHLGDLEEIISNVSYDYVIYPKYDEILSKYKLDTFVPVDSNYNFSLNNIVFEIISPISDLNDVNDNSICLKFKMDNFRYLYCGDISSKTEQAIINNDINISCDIIKVAHHGSSTSSTLNFIKLANPKYAIISCGKNNKYGFPNEDVLYNLKQYATVLITYEKGNITFKCKNNKLEINTFY